MNKLLNFGDVIRTNPVSGYWGIAIVLSEREKTIEFDPMCHIALTPLVFQHEVDISELRLEDLTVLEIEHYNFNPLGNNPESNKVIGVYSRIVNEATSVIGSIDPKPLYDGPLPFSPDYGLEITWPLCGNVDTRFGIQAITHWLRAYDPAALDRLFGDKKEENTIDDDTPEDELWVMIKMDQYFHSLDEINIEEELIDLVESGELGEFDGRSSGAYQFDLNFYEVTSYEKAKKAISEHLDKHYPELEYEISNTYETTFDEM